MTQIAPAIPSQVPQFIFYLGSQATPEAGCAASSTLEGAFYASLRAGSAGASRFVKWVRESTVSRIHEIQMVFNAANVLIVAYYAKQFVDEVQGRFQFSVVDLAAAWTFGALPVVLAAGTAFAVGVLIIDRFTQTPAADQINGQVTISQKMSTQQKIAKALHVTKLVLNVGLACVAKNRFWFVVGLAGSGYSLLKNANIQWLNFTKKFNTQFERIPECKAVPVTYNMLALKPDASAAREKCAICRMGDEPNEQQTDMAFCTNHVFHKTCMAQAAVTKSNGFLNGSRIIKHITDHYTNGVHTRTSYSYSVIVPQESFSNCPLCRDFPLQNGCNIVAHDSDVGDRNASVTIQRPEDNQSLFEKFYAVYNTAQAGLAALQQYPELAAGIYSIQQVMVATDVLGLLGTAYYLQKRVAEKWNISPANMTKFRIAAAVTLVAVGALSYLAVLQINAYLQSALVLKDLLAQLEISPDILKTIDVKWASAAILQSLYLTRITMSVALSYFSKQRILSIWNAIAQAASFGAISRLKWVEFSQTFGDYPLKKVFAEGGTHTTSLNEWSLPKLTVTSEFLVDNSCAKDPGHMKSVLKSIYGYMSKVLDKSSWHRYWHINYTNGIETGRTLCYSVGLQNTRVLPCDCTLTPGLTGLSMSGQDTQYGRWAEFNIRR